MHDRQVKTAKRIGRQVLVVCLLVVFAGCASLSTKPADTDEGLRTITEIDMESVSDAEQVVIRSIGELEYSAVKQRDPLGVILYFPETRLSDMERERTFDGDLVRAVRATPSADNENVRVEIDLDADFDYEVDKSESFLRVLVKKSDSSNRSQPRASIQEMPRAEAAPAKTRRQAEKPEGSMASIRQIDFSSEEDGKSSIIIGTNYPVDYEIRRLAERRLQLRMFDVVLPEHRKHRPLITTRFDSAVDRVTPVQTPGLKDTVDFIIELRERVPYRADRDNNRLTLHFDRSTVAPRPFAAADLPSWKEVLQESIAQLTPEDLPDVPKAAPVTEDGALRSLYDAYFGEPEYTGEKVALDFHETNIKNVFRILQPISGKNYAIDPDVEGTVSISMERPVPWDQVLDLILTMNGLGKVEQGDIIRISRLQTLREEEQARQERVRDLQRKQEDQRALEPLVTEYIPISYANAQAEVLPHIRDIISAERGKVSVDARNNQIIITDVRGNIQKAREIISHIDKVTPQVTIEARIVEVSTDFSREIGTSWSASADDIYRSDLGGLYGYNVSMNHPAPAASAVEFSFERLSAMGTPFSLNARLNAMEQQGEGKIISSPKIVTMDNKTALITQGFEYPYRVRGEAGADPTTEFKDIDLRLEVTPQVTPDNRISMQLHITKDDIDRILPTGEPSLSTNEARTELLVDDGSTIVIGGIRKEQESFTEEGFPILQHIPVLGWMFKSRSNVREKRELLIFLTPTIVQLEQRELAGSTN